MDLYLDIGSTNVKWTTSEEDLCLSRPFPAPVRCDTPYFEVDAEEIVRTVREIIGDVHPDRVFISVQMHGYVLLHNGKAVTPYVSWRDTRGGDEIPAFCITADYGVNLKRNLPRLSVQTQTVQFDEFCTLGSYLAKRLTGNNKTHITDAAPSGFFNVNTRTQDPCGFRLPEACYGVKAVGKCCGATVFCPMGDQQCAVLGAAGEHYRGYILNLGTAAQLCRITPVFEKGAFESRPYFFGQTLCTVTGLSGGAVLSQLTDGEAEERLVEEYGRALKALPSAKEVLVTGGLVHYRRPLIERVLTRLGLEYRINGGSDALDGLKKLSKIVERKQIMRKSGLMLSEIPFANMPVLLKNAGLDFVILDYEHGGFDYADMSRIIMNARLCGLEMIVRLPNNGRKDIIKLMDMGADGLLLPMTNGAEDIAQVVKYAKYQPIGERGISTMRAHTFYNPPSVTEYTVQANARTKVYAQLETKAGVENAQEILSLQGVDGCFIGPNDLSADYGCLADGNAPEVLSAIERAGTVAAATGKLAGIITGNANYLKKAKECGFTVFSVGSELNAVHDYCKRIIEKVNL